MASIMVGMMQKEKNELLAGIRIIFREEIREELKEIRRILDLHTETIGAIMVKVTIIEEDVIILKEDVASIKITLERKADVKDLVALDHRVHRLER